MHVTQNGSLIVFFCAIPYEREVLGGLANGQNGVHMLSVRARPSKVIEMEAWTLCLRPPSWVQTSPFPTHLQIFRYLELALGFCLALSLSLVALDKVPHLWSLSLFCKMGIIYIHFPKELRTRASTKEVFHGYLS